MGDLGTFIAGLAATALLGWGTAWHLKPHLNAILTDLCGTEVRANFWMAFSTICLVAVPTLFALVALPAPAAASKPAFQLVQQLKWALIGLIATVGIVGMVLWSFIKSGPRPIIELPAATEMGGSYERRD